MHIQPGVRTGSAGTWRNELAELPRPAERIRVLAGDFNASLDHARSARWWTAATPTRRSRRANGLKATWSSWPFGPPVTIDHILVDDRCAFGSYAVFDVPGSDHKAWSRRSSFPDPLLSTSRSPGNAITGLVGGRSKAGLENGATPARPVSVGGVENTGGGCPQVKPLAPWVVGWASVAWIPVAGRPPLILARAAAPGNQAFGPSSRFS